MNGNILESEAQQGQASEPSESRDRSGQRESVRRVSDRKQKCVGKKLEENMRNADTENKEGRECAVNDKYKFQVYGELSMVETFKHVGRVIYWLSMIQFLVCCIPIDDVDRSAT